MTRVGVVLSSYNRPEGLSEALDSLRAQTHADWICVVADDHSEDPLVGQVADFAERLDPRFVVLRGHPRFTAEQKRRVCTLSLRINEAQDVLRTMGCDVFSYLLDDVVYHPTRLAAHVEALEAHPEAALVWGEQWLVQHDADGNVVEERRQVPEGGMSEFKQHYLRSRLAKNNFINHCSATHRSTRARWNTRAEAWQICDWKFWQAMVEAGADVFLHIDHVGETMSSGPNDIGPSMHFRRESIADIARARGGQ